MSIIDLNPNKNIFMLGIGGCGVSALAKILHEMGYKISGSDLKESPNTMRLKDLGVKVYIGHDAGHLREADIVIASTAIHKNNVEIIEASSREIPIYPRAEALSWIMDQFETKVAVSGTHGKTTTTSMIAQILYVGGLDPTYLIGGDMDYVHGNARLGKGKFVVAEADESDGSFLRLNPNVAIVTNIEEDHMEYFGDANKLMEYFEKFTNKLPKDGLLIINSDHPNNLQLLKNYQGKAVTYGFNHDAEYYADNIRFNENGSTFDVYKSGKKMGEVNLSIPGEQNVSNALAALAFGFEFNIDLPNMARALQTFTGAKRRFQIIDQINNIMIVDDYAHHPTEIKATLKAAKTGWKDRRIVCVFQPHRYTRTLYLHHEFGKAFDLADIIILTDIYTAGEAPIPGITGETIVAEIDKSKEVHFIPRKEKICDYLLEIVKPGDIVITAGAGDIYTVGKELATRLKMRKQ